MSNGKLTEKIYNIFNFFLGAKNGFMPIICILTAMFYSSISGSAVGVTAAVGGMCMPLLIEMGYDPAFCGAILCCAGVLGFIIPPSTSLTVCTGMTGMDLTTIYAGGAVLGLAIGAMLIIYTYVFCRIKGAGDRDIIMRHHLKVRNMGFVNVIKDGIWALISPGIILGGIFSGLLTIAQAAAVSCVYGALVSIYIYKTLTWETCLQSIIDGLEATIPLIVVLFAANVFSTCLQALDAATLFSNVILGSGMSNSMVVLMILAILMLLGMFMDSGTVTYTLVPIIYPIAVKLGIPTYPLLVSMVGIQCVGLISPPVGLALFTMVRIANVSVGDISRKVLVPLVLFILINFSFALFPGLTAGWLFP